ncbi:MAG TPA: hypothetical protein VKV95_17605 [Terriglobia bacterium]|nr:hypothetical protein [Terriglobia bacterium]
MAIQVSDTASHRRDQIANFAELLRNAPIKQQVFKAVYTGKKKVKTLDEIAQVTGIATSKRVTEFAKPLARERIFLQEKQRIDGKVCTVYRKIDFVEQNKRKILQLARNSMKLGGYHTKTNPENVGTKTQRVVIQVPFRFKIRFVSIEDVNQFERVKTIRDIPQRMTPERLPEKKFKKGILRLLKEVYDPKDWGGESNDVFTTRLKIRGRTLRAAFALKGPAKKGPLVPAMMGKNGDQIQRLFNSPAEVFFVQYEGEIRESVIDLMEKLSTAKAILGKEVFFGVIALQDSYRLRLAYPTQFNSK